MGDMIELVEGAARCKVDYHTMHRWALRGLVRSERRNGRWWVSAEDVERLAQQRARKLAPPAEDLN